MNNCNKGVPPITVSMFSSVASRMGGGPMFLWIVTIQSKAIDYHAGVYKVMKN